jgi:hypothetical protein
MSRRGRRTRYRKPMPVLLAGFLVVVLLVLAFHWREQRRAAPPAALPTPVAVAASPIDRAREGRLVQVAGMTSSPAPVVDPLFGVSGEGVALIRRVEMRQWQERTEVTGAAAYVPVWSETLIDSSAFLETDRHANPARMPFESERFGAEVVRLGDFVLGHAVLSRVGGPEQPIAVEASTLPENLAASFGVHDGVLHTASDPGQPDIGDLRVSFLHVPHAQITVVARQVGHRLEPMTQPDGRSHIEVRRGPSR